MACKLKQAALSFDRLKAVIHYNPDTGEFTRIAIPGKQTYLLGTKAGNVSDSGYIRIGIDSISYRAHRVAWFYMTGAWPTEMIDHINGDRSDNRFANLREATHKQNLENMKVRNKNSGVKGVHWYANRWIAVIRHNNKSYHLGRFKSLDEAIKARTEAERKYFTHSQACGLQGGNHESRAPIGETQSVSLQCPQTPPQQRPA